MTLMIKSASEACDFLFKILEDILELTWNILRASSIFHLKLREAPVPPLLFKANEFLAHLLGFLMFKLCSGEVITFKKIRKKDWTNICISAYLILFV